MLLIVSFYWGDDVGSQQGSNWIPKVAIIPPAEPPKLQISPDRPEGSGSLSPRRRHSGLNVRPGSGPGSSLGRETEGRGWADRQARGKMWPGSKEGALGTTGRPQERMAPRRSPQRKGRESREACSNVCTHNGLKRVSAQGTSLPPVSAHTSTRGL